MQEKKKMTWAQAWDMIDHKVFIPGVICLLALVAVGALFPTQSGAALANAVTWIMGHFKWFYILVTILICGLFAVICFTKLGDIRLGGKNAKPSLKTSTWFTLSLTGTIAVGICFYGVSGPVNMFMNPPAFMGVEAGSKEAIIPVLEYCFLNYSFPPFFLIVAFAMAIAIMYYNCKRTLKASDTLYPLLGEKSKGIMGTIMNTFTMICLMVCGTNMGLAVIQLNAGIGTVAGMDSTPAFEPIIIVFYTLLTVVFATSGVHEMMGKLSNINATCYFAILAFILLFGGTGMDRLIGTFFTSMGEFIVDFIPMVTFADPVLQTGWQNDMTMYYYAWNIVPGFMQALFYVSIAYGRTLRQFILINCVAPGIVTCFWYIVFGGSAMYGITEGSNLYAMMQQFGDGISTFAFLETLPGGTFFKWLFIVLAIMTFITFSDSIAFSFPMLFMKKTEADASKTTVPKILNAAVGLFMGVLTFVLLYIGGYDALNQMVVFLGFPGAILLFLALLSLIKMLTNREKYDVTYQEELAELQANK